MSRLARTDIDVRISSHKSGKNGMIIIITFYDGVEQLLDNYIKLEITGDRLYFKPSPEKVSKSVKLNTVHNTLSVCRNALGLKEFEGEYKTLHYDVDNDLYYIDKSDALSISRLYGNHNCKHYNYKSHKGSIKPVVEETSTEKIPVVENLIKALFDFQVYVEGMDSAVKLLDELQTVVKR